MLRRLSLRPTLSPFAPHACSYMPCILQKPPFSGCHRLIQLFYVSWVWLWIQGISLVILVHHHRSVAPLKSFRAVFVAEKLSVKSVQTSYSHGE
jgi:hypothetical protein